MCPPTRKVRILLYRGRGLVAWLIRWQTRSEYSHAAFLFEDGIIYESVYPDGCVPPRQVTPTDVFTSDCYFFETSGDKYVKLRKWCADHVGCKYDKLAIFRFIDRHHDHPNDKFFCSEFVEEACEDIEHPLQRCPPWKANPGLLGMSLMITKET